MLEERVYCKQEEEKFETKLDSGEGCHYSHNFLFFGEFQLDINELQRVCKILNELSEEKQQWILNGDENNLGEK